MSYNIQSFENRFDEFVESTNKKFEELESLIKLLKDELHLTKRETKRVVILNEEIKNSLGSKIKTVNDIVNGK